MSTFRENSGGNLVRRSSFESTVEAMMELIPSRNTTAGAAQL